jgi:rare lipoprotein A
MGANKNFVAAAVLAGLAAMASSGFASEPVVPDVLHTDTAKRQDQWSHSDQWSQSEMSAEAKKPALDRSGGKRYGKASFYANFFAGKKMADGTIMDPQTDNAASRTLPLGTKAKVTNLQTGKSAVVTIQDRGPYVDGRIVDLSPSTAQKIGITRREGIAKVEVTPIAVPMPDGRIKLGAAASDPQVAVNLRGDRGTGAGW